MPSQRQSSGTLQRQGVPIPARLEGPRTVQTRAQPTYTSYTAAPRQRQPRQRAPRRRRSYARSSRPNINVADYSPTRRGEQAGGIGLLEAEYFAIIFLLIINLFVGTNSYGDKIMSFMKRGFLTSVLFFFLALVSAAGPNATKVAKAIGALVFFAILLSAPGQAIVDALDGFFKADWTGTAETNTASADAGSAGSSSGTVQKIENAVTSGANRTTEIQIPGIGPALVLGIPIIDKIKSILGL